MTLTATRPDATTRDTAPVLLNLSIAAPHSRHRLHRYDVFGSVAYPAIGGCGAVAAAGKPFRARLWFRGHAPSFATPPSLPEQLAENLLRAIGVLHQLVGADEILRHAGDLGHDRRQHIRRRDGGVGGGGVGTAPDLLPLLRQDEVGEPERGRRGVPPPPH